MPYAHHADPAKKWQQQYQVTKNHIIPFIEQYHNLPKHAKILEVGCGEGGVLKAFTDKGHTCYGVDLSPSRIEHANNLLKQEVENEQISFYAGDVHDTQLFEQLIGNIDLLILKDAIEHICDREKMFTVLHKFVKNDGVAFIAFPPWHNPFGGHQQLAGSVLKYVPWFHILPQTIYRDILNLFQETGIQIKVLMEIYDTRLSIRKFDNLLSKTNWLIKKRQFFLLNPIYEVKFGIKGCRQSSLISGIPVLRDFVSTAVYYIIDK